MPTESPSRTQDASSSDGSGSLSVKEHAKQHNYMCQICGGILHPRGDRVGWSSTGHQNVTILVCEAVDCYDGEERKRREQQARQWKQVEPGVSVLYARALLREVKQRVRLFAHSGRFLIVRRTLTLLGGSIGLVMAMALVAGVLGALAVSSQTSLVWGRAVITAAQTGILLLIARPWIGGLLVGGGYFLHTREREWHHVNIRIPADRDRREWKMITNPSKAAELTEPSPEVFLSRPTWHTVAIASGCSLFGGIDWVLISTGVLGNRFGAVVIWTVGTLSVGVLLKRSVRSDVTEYGLSIRPVWWVFTSRYGAVVGGVTIAAAVIPLLVSGGIGPLSALHIQQLVTIAVQVSPPWLDPVVVLTPGVVGSWYMTRRYALVRSGRGSALLRILTQPLSLGLHIRQHWQNWRASRVPPVDSTDPAETASGRDDDSEDSDSTASNNANETNGSDGTTVSGVDIDSDDPSSDSDSGVNANVESANTTDETSTDPEIAPSTRMGDAPPASYQLAREQAFERDEYTCQLCGERGYPHAQRGLAGWVADEDVATGDYRIANIVTVCQPCIQEFEKSKLDRFTTLVKQRLHDESSGDGTEDADDT